jgi:hypothetical protein
MLVSPRRPEVLRRGQRISALQPVCRDRPGSDASLQGAGFDPGPTSSTNLRAWAAFLDGGIIVVKAERWFEQKALCARLMVGSLPMVWWADRCPRGRDYL